MVPILTCGLVLSNFLASAMFSPPTIELRIKNHELRLSLIPDYYSPIQVVSGLYSPEYREYRTLINPVSGLYLKISCQASVLLILNQTLSYLGRNFLIIERFHAKRTSTLSHRTQRCSIAKHFCQRHVRPNYGRVTPSLCAFHFSTFT